MAETPHFHRRINAYWLGQRAYAGVHALQEKLLEARKQGRIGDTLLLLEHRPVITLGRGAKPEHVLLSSERLRAQGIDVQTVGRGGDVTYHGPGQLVAYPILDLSPDRCDVRRYVRDLAFTMILLAADHGIAAGLMEHHVGIWVDRLSTSAWPGDELASDPAKLGAIGVRLSRWVTMHGFAFNARADLNAYDLIVPCGIREYGVTSLHRLVGDAPAPMALGPRAAQHFCAVMDATLESYDFLDGREDYELGAALGLGGSDVAVHHL